MDGDAVVPGLGGTRQQQRCLLLDGQQGLRAADGHVAGGRRQVEQHQHAAARRLDAGGTNSRPSGASARRRSTCTSMAASRSRSSPSTAGAGAGCSSDDAGCARAWRARCGRQAVKCCGQGTTRARCTSRCVRAAGGSPIPGRGGRCPRRWVVLRHRSAECRPPTRRRAGGAAGTCSASVVSSAVAPCCQR